MKTPWLLKSLTKKLYSYSNVLGISNHFNHHSFVDYFFFNSLLANRDEWQVCCTRWYIWIFFRVSFQEDFKLENLVPGTYSCILQSHHNRLKFENFSSRDYETWRHYLDKIKPLCIILLSLLSQSLLVSFLRIRGATHAPGASSHSIKVNRSVHTLSTFLRIRAAPSMQIFWISVKVALSDTLFFVFFFSD